jgi:hypothetical protein
MISRRRGGVRNMNPFELKSGNTDGRVTGPMNRTDRARETDLRRSPSSRALATRSSNSKTISDPATDDGTPAIQIETGICGNHSQEDRDRKPDNSVNPDESQRQRRATEEEEPARTGRESRRGAEKSTNRGGRRRSRGRVPKTRGA